MADEHLVVVRTFTDRIEANLAKSALDAAGITCFVRSDDAGGLQPGMAFSNDVALVVRARDAKAAGEILDVTARRRA